MEKKLKAYTLFSSSKGNSTYIEYGGDGFLIDAGVSARRLQAALSALGTGLERIRAIFVSHEHTDHIKGLQAISKSFAVPVYTDPLCLELVGESCPAAVERFVPASAGDTVAVGDLKVEIFPTPHDSVRSFCYRISAGGESLGFATDIGHISEAVQDAVFGCENVVIEANYDDEMLKNGPYSAALKRRIAGQRGHLSNELCACLAPVLARCGTKSIVLAHLSETNNTPDTAYAAVRGKLREYGVTLAGETFAADLKLQVARPDGAVQITL